MDRLVCQASNQIARLTLLAGIIAGVCTASPAVAHFPDAARHPVVPRVDVIPPLGNRIPSYRERYNRPTYLGGKIAYWIAPSSQEAMSWHRSFHRGYYANHAPRMEDRYYYPKPWEELTVGPRVSVTGTDENAESGLDYFTPPASDAANLQSAPAVEALPAPQR